MGADKDLVYVEIDSTGEPVRIFRTTKQAVAAPAWDTGRVTEWCYAAAVQAIRELIFERDDYRCVHCGEVLTWLTAQMHERQARGDIQQTEDDKYQGGEISLDNGETRCHKCHTAGPEAAHQRNTQFTGSPK